MKRVVPIFAVLAVVCYGGAGAFAQAPQRQPIPKGLIEKSRKPIPSPAKPVVKDDFFKGKLITSTQETLVDVVLQDMANQLWEQADKNGHEGEYNHFINTARVLMITNPHEKEAWDTSAYLLWSTDRAAEGIQMLKDAIKANPDSYYFYDELGNQYLRTKDYKSAIPPFEKAITLNSPWTTYNLLATCYEKTNQLEKAVQTLEKGVTFPDNKVGQARLKRLQARLKDQKR